MKKALNIKKRPTKWKSQEHHRSYGIQNWLLSKGFCKKEGTTYFVDMDEYYELIKSFCKQSGYYKSMKPNKLSRLESYVHFRFQKFCVFCCNNYNPIKS